MEKKKIGIIFDMDGTILNTLEDLQDNVNYVLEFYQYPLRTLEEVRNFVGKGVRVLMERALPQDISTDRFEECLKLFKKHYFENLRNKTRPYDGIMDLLKELKRHDIYMGVVSNKFQSAVEQLNNDFFKDYISVAIGNKEGLQPKPSADSVNYAISLMHLNPKIDTIYYIGDSEVDILTARNANLPIISCTWGFRPKEELMEYHPDYFVDKPSEILNIVLKK